MEGFIDFIASNFVLLFIIITGLISLFKNKSTQRTENNEPSNIPEPTTKKAQTNQQEKIDERMQETIQTLSTEEAREQQLERLKDKVSVDRQKLSDEYVTKMSDGLSKPFPVKEYVSPIGNKEIVSDSDSLFKKELKENLNQKGLMESIVMAEVLGPPRALKPYRSRLSDRTSV